jgi:hypothetical protein
MDARPCFILLVLWDSYYSCDDTTCVHVFSSMPRFKTVFGSYLLPFVLQIVHVIFMLIVFIFANSCLTRYPYQMMLMSFNSNTTSTTGRARNNNPSRTHEFNRSCFVCGCFASVAAMLYQRKQHMEQELHSISEHLRVF